MLTCSHPEACPRTQCQCPPGNHRQEWTTPLSPSWPLRWANRRSPGGHTHHMKPHHITSHHITTYHITSRHTTPHHITSRHITPHHITSHHITSQHNNHSTSRYIAAPSPPPAPHRPGRTDRHITSHHITPHHTTSHHTTSHHITPHHITSHHPTHARTANNALACGRALTFTADA